MELSSTTIATSQLIVNLKQMASAMPGPRAIRQEEIDSAPPASAAAVPAKRHLSGSLGTTVVAVLALLIALGWHARSGAWFSSGKGFGYALGVTGGSLLLVMLLYPVRKRVRFMHAWGPLKYWFKFHMLAGVLGPLLVLFHSTFRVGSFNAGVALSCMLLVVASGLVGRFIYRQIHHGLYGSQATLKELQHALQQQVEALESLLRCMPAVKREVDAFITLASYESEAWYLRTKHFLTVGWKRTQAMRRVRGAIFAYVSDDNVIGLSSNSHFTGLLLSIDTTFRAVQRNIQFSTYERLFSLWHVVHIPFLCMLVITAVVHVVAVHIY